MTAMKKKMEMYKKFILAQYTYSVQIIGGRQGRAGAEH